ncbi:MAG: glycosyltransferase family 2 protein, partial [Acidimicrobiales bacterium]
MARRDVEMDRFRAALRAADADIERLEAQIETDEARFRAGVENLSLVLTERTEALDLIHNSLAWNLLDRYRSLLNRLAAPRSPTRRLYSAAVGGLKRRIIGKPPLPADSPAGPAEELKPLSLPRFREPEVSIIIPVHNRCRDTYGCLLSVMSNTAGVRYEVIVVDDASSDGTNALFSRCTNLRLVTNPANLGFVHSCNAGAAAARGRYLLFLNNDTHVQQGWLTALLRPMLADPSVGVVGAKLLYPDGKLQEAGAIIWRDGSGWNYGRNQEPGRPEYNYVREVDYCSGACLMVRRELFEQAGGFDARYAPAYYEDADLAFTARKLGYKVLYQ